MAKEKSGWSWLRDGTKSLRRELHMERIENMVSSGRADVNGCFNGSTFDIELKRGNLLKTRDTFDLRWETGQLPWLNKRWSVGGLTWALIFIGEGHKVQRFLIRGCDLESIGETRMVGKRVMQTASLEILGDLSVIDPKASAACVVSTAAGLQFG